jgi:hypothetical protein
MLYRIFFVIGIGAIIFNILDSIEKKYLALYSVEMDTGPDPDRQALEGGFRSAKMMPIRPDPQYWYRYR